MANLINLIFNLNRQNLKCFTKKKILDFTTKNLFFQQERGLKYKETLILRCLHCKFQKIDERWQVICDKMPRHNQIQKVRDYRTKWIVKHITRGGRAFQKHNEAYICNTCPPGPFDYKKKIWQKELIEKGKLFPKLKSFNYIS